MTTPYTLPDLPYDPAALEPHYSAEIVTLHHDKHHAAYVKGANETLQKLAAARAANDFATLPALEKSMAFHLSGHVLHSIFWTNMSPDGGGRPEGDLAAAIDEHFGGFDPFQAQLNEATTSIQGVGWGSLSWEPTSQRLIIEQIYDHQGNVGSGAVPLLVIDAWEHAYYLQFKNVKADWVKSFWNIVNWDDVDQRLQRARVIPSPL
jgi:Fe-Mn family superoxide dismutase